MTQSSFGNGAGLLQNYGNDLQLNGLFLFLKTAKRE